MASRQYHFHGGRKGAAITVRVTPRASKNEITEVQADGTVKIRLTSPPVDGKANEALVVFLAEVLGVAKSKIEILAGLTGREKLVTILDMDAETVQKKILEKLA